MLQNLDIPKGISIITHIPGPGMVRFTPKQQISMVFMEIARIAVSVKTAVLAEIAILVKTMVSIEKYRFPRFRACKIPM